MVAQRAPLQPGSTPSACEFCGRTLGFGFIDVSVRVSRHLDPHDSRLDGHRLTRACTENHAKRLIRRGREQWLDEQLWAGKLARIPHGDRRSATVDILAARAGLTVSQTLRAIQWTSDQGVAGRMPPR